MATLTGKKIKDTYDGLLKTSDNLPLTSLLTEIQDGTGQNSGIKINNLGQIQVERILFDKSEIRSGNGENSIRIGDLTYARGKNTFATGNQTEATGQDATAMGDSTLASGRDSTSHGERTIASGPNSTTFGESTLAEGINSTAMGRATEAIGDNSFVTGTDTKAIGERSTAMGYGSWASGNNSTALGIDTRANAANSTTMGKGTIANSLRETVIGSYPTDKTGNPTLWRGDERMFTVGNGKTESEKSTALEILKNGNVVLPAVVGLNFTNDTAAAAGGVPIGGLYHKSGNIRIRLT